MAELGPGPSAGDAAPTDPAPRSDGAALIASLVDALGQGAGTRAVLRSVLPGLAATAGAARAALVMWHASPAAAEVVAIEGAPPAIMTALLALGPAEVAALRHAVEGAVPAVVLGPTGCNVPLPARLLDAAATSSERALLAPIGAAGLAVGLGVFSLPGDPAHAPPRRCGPSWRWSRRPPRSGCASNGSKDST
ncbi:MAG: hypothetical protein FJ029_12920 [Actinobacteria bacterium]|nr:hypothetical protein [Actinomycetota bacterium]